jgi:hypothetical protein
MPPHRTASTKCVAACLSSIAKSGARTSTTTPYGPCDIQRMLNGAMEEHSYVLYSDYRGALRVYSWDLNTGAVRYLEKLQTFVCVGVAIGYDFVMILISR